MCANERTKAILSATFAISGKTPPNSTPGRLVFTAPTVLRNSTGRRHLGIEGFDLRGSAAQPEPDDGGVAGGLAVRGCRSAGAEQIGQQQAAQAECADLRKSRRVAPSQLVPWRDASRLNMRRSFCPVRLTASRPQTGGKWVCDKRRDAPYRNYTLVSLIVFCGAVKWQSRNSRY